MTRRRRVRVAGALALAAVLALAGCGSIPRDPDGTLERISGGVLRVGASPSAGLVDVEEGLTEGPLVETIERFAQELDTRTIWTVGSEEELVREIEEGSLDLAIGGMTDQTPWTRDVGVTRAYPDLSENGIPIVMFVPLGENGFLRALEEFLDREVAR